jgi:hypothetical protein
MVLMSSAMKHNVGAKLSQIEGKIGELASWPSPGTGLAFHILQLIDDGQPHWPPSVKLSFPEGQLDTAPLIAAAGYSMCVAAPNSDQFARWQSALHRFTKRDPFPRDRQTFAFRPSELVAIALGISKSNVGGSPTAAWIRSVVETLPAKNPAQDVWALLIHHYAAALVGIPWPMSLPSRLTDYELPELCLLYALLSQGKIPQPTEVDNRRLAKAIAQRTVAMTQDFREPEKLAALVAGISLALRSELADFDAEGANPVTARLNESDDSEKSPCDDSSRPLVVLVHGIRTSGKWMLRIKPVLESESGCVVESAGFGFFDIFRFLLPGPTRKSVIETVRWKLLHAVDLHKGRPLVIIGHSFGTFCISEILKDSPQIRPVRLLFCGSIVAQNFRWDSLSQMAPDRGMRVVNECGARDIWPPLAHSVTFGYGSSGTGGFQVPGVKDRFHDLGHSGYFTNEFVRQFWVPFIKDGTIARSKFEEDMPEAPWWSSLIGLRPILPWLLWILLAVFASLAVFGAKIWPPKGSDTGKTNGTSAKLVSVVAAVSHESQQAERYAEDRYQAVAAVLRNPKAAVAEQIAALRELPEAMCARVPVAIIDESAPNGVRTEFNLPNLIRLRTVFRDYIRFDRTAEFTEKPTRRDFFTTLSPLGDASTEILHVLHRLGPTNPAKPTHNLWTWLPKQYQSGIPRASGDDPVPQPRSGFERQDERVLELTHMAAGDFEKLCVPFAMYDTQRPARWTVVFPKGSSFRQARLQGASLYRSVLNEADFTEADLQRACFLLSKMRRATFYKTSLQAASIQQADLRGAHFEDCAAKGIDFVAADLSGARFGFCGLEGADFEQAKLDWGRILGNLAGASLRFTSLKGTHLRSNCEGADLSEAVVTGAMLEGSSFGGQRCFVLVERVTGPPSGSFAWPGLFQPTYDTSNQMSAGRVEVLFPGAILSQLKGMDEPLEYVRLSGVSRDDCIQRLASAAKTQTAELAEQTEDFLAQVRYLSDHEVEEVIWPIELEPVLNSAFGANRVSRASRTITLLRVGAGRVEFYSPSGAAWMDKGTLESFTRLLKAARLPNHRDDLNDWLVSMASDLSIVEPRGSYFGAWLDDRSKWSVWKELEKQTPSVSK